MDKLIITLEYYHEYRSMQHIAFDYGVVKSTVCDSISWVENVLVDVTEVEIERPQKNKNNITQVKRKNTH